MTNGRRSRCRCTKTSATGRHENNLDRACLVAGGLEERKAQCFAGVVIPTFLQAATSAASFALHLPAVSKWPDFEDRHVQPLRFARKQLTCSGEHGPIGKQSRRAANKIEEKLDGAPLNQLIPAFGVAIDKVAALSADPFTQANQQHLHLHLQAVDLIGSFNKYLDSIGTVNSPNNSSDGFPIPSDRSPIDIYSKEKALEDRCATEELPRSTMLKPAKNRIEPRRS